MSNSSQLSPSPPERVLLRELSHRINNEFASAIGLVAVAESRCEDSEAKGVLALVRGRLQGYANVHHSLQMPEYNSIIDLAAYLEQLCRAISYSKLERDGIAVSLSLNPLRMTSERCWILGMIIFELLTNAARHGFRGAGGTIHIEVLPNRKSIECCITDNGTSDEDPSPGRGLSIIAALVDSLRGTVDMRFGSDGTKTIVRFPIE